MKNMTESKGLKFVEKLAYRLSESGYRIVSGYGLGIGNSIVSGVLKQRRNLRKNNIQDVLSLRPRKILSILRIFLIKRDIIMN
ncbi:hypothetical protein EfmAA610_05570 [Enterococcus faecium]|nr:hypothetical protein EfmAA610_05570 [Enterococcus faecium]